MSTGGRFVSHAAIAGLAAAAAGTSLFGWRLLTEEPGRLWWPLALLTVLVAGLGVLGRWQRLPLLLLVPLQVLVAAAVVLGATTGSAAPTPDTIAMFVDALRAGVESARTYVAPVPASAPPIHPLLLLGGAAVVLVMDLVAGLLRQPAIGGLVLLSAHVVPALITGDSGPWWVFALGAGLFLALIAAHHRSRLDAWGTTSGDEGPESARRGVGTAWCAASVGAGAVLVGLVVPLVLPTPDVTLLDGSGGGGSGSGPVQVVNPMADLRRDLTRGRDLRLLRVDTSGPRPDYLRLSVLSRFVDGRWTPGDRDIPSDQAANGPMPELDGVSLSLPRQEDEYRVRVGPDFHSTWLPTTAQVSYIDAGSQWRYDDATRDFIAVGEDTNTANMDYQFTGVQLQYDADSMNGSASATGSIPGIFTETPPSIDEEIHQLAEEVTADAPTRFQKAQALQRWFRHTGGFRYDLAPAESLGNGTADLKAFLDEDTGRVGYCEQFAASMAIMARTLGIPSRVAVGFLVPSEAGPGTWEFSAWDLHAWPELYFPGSGWVRFEPTPSARAGQAPDYSTREFEAPEPTASPSPTATATPSPQQSVAPEVEQAETAEETEPVAWRQIIGWSAGALVVVAALLAPALLRRARRRRRLADGIEGAWGELRATTRDLGLAWPTGLSPRQTGDEVARLLPDPESSAALGRLVTALERHRYSAGGSQDDSHTWDDDVVTVEESLAGTVAGYRRVRARWWPRVFSG